METPVFVIGDVHGHLDRLEALLKQEGLLGWCSYCDGSGSDMQVRTSHGIITRDCVKCHGDGWARTDKDAIVIQVGDLAHVGYTGSPTGDELCYRHAYNGWIDVILWGNHERPLVQPGLAFTDYTYNPTVAHYIQKLHEEGRMQLAVDAHGFLITHAGLHAAFEHQNLDDLLKTNLTTLVDWLNDWDDIWLDQENGSEKGYSIPPDFLAIRDAIHRHRGGHSPAGGILWRDINEKLYSGFRQIFGHSADHSEHQVRYCSRDSNSRKNIYSSLPSYCIDIGGKGSKPDDSCLAGIWLPEERIARVDL